MAETSLGGTHQQRLYGENDASRSGCLRIPALDLSRASRRQGQEGFCVFSLICIFNLLLNREDDDPGDAFLQERALAQADGLGVRERPTSQNHNPFFSFDQIAIEMKKIGLISF
jgi:hypothetical protein